MTTQESRLLSYMIEHNGVTSLDGFNKLGIVNVHARISDLRKQGYSIGKKMQRGKNRYGETTHFYRYYLQDNINPFANNRH